MLAEVVVTQNASARAMAADELAAVAVEVFGADRVIVEPRLDDALETAVRLAEDGADGVLVGAGVLVTGSVVTAGEARTLLQPGRGRDRAGRRPRRRAPDRADDPSRGATRPTGGGGPTGRPGAGWPALLCLEAFVVLLVPRAIAQTSPGLSTTNTVLLVALAVLLVAAARSCCAGRGGSGRARRCSCWSPAPCC